MPRVVVVGSCSTVLTVHVPVLPAPGQTMLGDSFAVRLGGRGCLHARAALRAGADVVLVSAIGADDLGRRALELLRGEGIGSQAIKTVPDVSSAVSMRMIGKEAEELAGAAPGANLRFSPGDIDRLPDSVFTRGAVLLVALEVPIPTAIRAMRRGRASGMRVILNPAPAPSLSELEVGILLEQVDIVVSNRLEAIMLAGIRRGERPEPAVTARRLLELGPRAAVITLGPDGCLIAEGTQTQHLPSACLADAGRDAFHGDLAAAIGTGLPLSQAVARALQASGQEPQGDVA